MSIPSVTVTFYKQIKIYFKLVMSKQNRSTNLDNRSRKTFLCCQWFTKRSTAKPPPIDEFPDNEPYDYVVEKLCIRKVPLTLFATLEDLEKESLKSTAAQPIMNQKQGKQELPSQPIAESKSSVTFASYYKMAPRPDIEHITHSNVTLPDPSYRETEIVSMGPSRYQKSSTVIPEDRESLLVSQILNTHSSIYTLDTKEIVPKDPSNYRPSEVKIPESLKTALARQQKYQHGAQQSTPYKNKIQVEVHKTSMVTPTPKKNMTPDIELTINALGHAQKPHIPGVPPKNQKSKQPDLAYEYPEMGYSSAFVLKEGTPSYEMGCFNLNILNDSTPEMCEHENVLGHENLPLVGTDRLVRNAAICMQHNYNSVSTQHKPELPFIKNVSTQHYNTEVPHCDRGIMVPTMKTEEVQISRENGGRSANSLKLNHDNKTTEISQLKGQNLKWKIIIKHHSDKNKQHEKKTLTEIEESDNDSENGSLSNGSSSPDQ